MNYPYHSFGIHNMRPLRQIKAKQNQKEIAEQEYEVLEGQSKSLSRDIDLKRPDENTEKLRLERERQYVFDDMAIKAALIEQYEEDILELSGLRELLGIVWRYTISQGAVSESVVSRAYQASLLGKKDGGKEEEDLHKETLRKLLRLADTSDNYLLLHFISRIISDKCFCDECVQIDLHCWLESLGLSAIPFPPTENYLMIRVSPHEENDYCVKAKLIEAVADLQTDVNQLVDMFGSDVGIDSSMQYSQNELRYVFRDAMHYCQHVKHIATHDLIVEWFLPITLLHLDAEQWSVEETRRICAGELCKAVVVRISDNGFSWPNRESFWQQLYRNRLVGCSQVLEVVDISNRYGRRTRGNPETVGYQFCADSDPRRQQDFWEDFLQESLPVAMWIRDSTMDPQIAETLMQSIVNGSIGMLATNLTNYRRDPTILPEVANVSLLWDNPFRPFPGSTPMFRSQNNQVSL